MTTSTVHVHLGERSYDIQIGSQLLSNCGQTLGTWWRGKHGGSSAGTALVVTDRNVLPHATRVLEQIQGAGWRVGQFVMEPGENSKRQEVITAAYDVLVDLPADRRTIVVAVGGGVVGDAAGFMAATFNRGLPFVQVPTTLLAAVDSSVGGKVGINHPRAKNLIGAFHQPLGVLIDVATLETLPDREYRSGLAEVVKYGVIADAEFFHKLEVAQNELNSRRPETLMQVISRCCQLKADVVEQDEFERTGLRAILNYGHTFAHAFEALAGYGELLHGEAVSIGMVYASRLAERLGRIPASLTTQQVQLLEALHLPVRLSNPAQMTTEAILGCMKLDKKTVGGKLRFVLPSRMGSVELVPDVSDVMVREVLAEMGHH